MPPMVAGRLTLSTPPGSSTMAGGSVPGVPIVERALELLRAWVDAGQLPAAALCVGHRGRLLGPWYFGRLHPRPDAPPVSASTLFPVASLTKPVTAAALLLLVQRGDLTLHDRVTAYVPEFAGEGRE